MDETTSGWARAEAFVAADSPISPADLTVAPEDAPCWARVDVRTQVWGQAAVIRTVGALPSAHPWRLGGSSGSVRQVPWTGRPATVPGGGRCVLSPTAKDPHLSAGELPSAAAGLGLDLLTGDALTSVVAGTIGNGIADVVNALSAGREQRWAGAIVRLPGTWLPAAALLPRGIPGVPSPRTHWATESVEFDERFVVHSENEKAP